MSVRWLRASPPAAAALGLGEVSAVRWEARRPAGMAAAAHSCLRGSPKGTVVR